MFLGAAFVGVSALLLAALIAWKVQPNPQVVGPVGDPGWPGRGSSDVLTPLRTAYLSDVEPILRAKCYACHTTDRFTHDEPLVASMSSWAADLVQTHRTDGLNALDLSDGFPFSRNGTIDIAAIPGDLQGLERELHADSMPPWTFVAAHPSTRLTPSEQGQLLAWVADAQLHLGVESTIGRTPTAQVRTLLRNRCEECHQDSSRTPVRGIMNLARLQRDGWIVPGNATESRLFQAVSAGRMPPTAPLNPEEIELLRVWITQGARLDQSPGEAPSAASLRETIIDDVQRLPAGKRDRARYFSIAHIAEARADASTRELYRDALTTVLASFGRSSAPVEVEVVGSDGLIFRADLESYGLTPAVLSHVERAYPYSITPSGQAGEHSKTIRRVTRSSVDVMAADWFIHAATLPDLYHQLAGIPDTVDELERSLSVERCADFRSPGSTIRAGVRDSGVSRNHRVVERHEGQFGYYWVSYDFGRTGDDADILTHPLGPTCLGPGQLAFREDGQEIIWSLRNGFQGYMVVDAQGRRIDTDAPRSIVSEGERTVINAQSCMGCHTSGLIPARDVVRDETAVSHPRVAELYAPQSATDAAIATDSLAYQAALIRTGVSPFWANSPVTTVTRRYEQDVPWTEVQALLGTTEPAPTIGPLQGLASTGLIRRGALHQGFGGLVADTSSGTYDPPEQRLTFNEEERRQSTDNNTLPGSVAALRVGDTDLFMTEEVTQNTWRQTMKESLRCGRELLAQDPDLDIELTPNDPSVAQACISFVDAARFANELSTANRLAPVYVIGTAEIRRLPNANGYRLPTAAEHQAALADSPFGVTEDSSQVCAFGNVLARSDLVKLAGVTPPTSKAFPCSDRHIGVAPTASYTATKDGLHDLVGNVGEWVWPDADTAVLSEEQQWVGGSWLTGQEAALSINRQSLAADTRRADVGVRLVRGGAELAAADAKNSRQRDVKQRVEVPVLRFGR